LVKLFTSILGIEITNDFLKDLPNISFQVRKLIKDNRRELLEIIDSPEFLPSYIYLLL
jgi:mRNA-degrading endonuclease RelE of RelBE toxin-antitoxin system